VSRPDSPRGLYQPAGRHRPWQCLRGSRFCLPEQRHRVTTSVPLNSAHGSRPTTEVFIDPTPAKRVRVWFEERTGQREYHPE
jgi:hypothetical protein